MKTSFKTLLFIFFIPFMLLTFPLYSWAVEEASTQTKDIQIIDNPYEFGAFEDKEDEYTIINVSIEDIRERILKGEPVHFVEKQDDIKRTIESTLIIEAIKNGVEKIDIKNAIITGDLDFRIKENVVDIEESGIEVDEINKPKGSGVEKVYLVSPSINIESCQLQGNLEAGYFYNPEIIVVFKKPVSIISSRVVNRADLNFAIFKEKVDFGYTSFKEKAYFGSATFNGEADFRSATFKEKAYFGSATFKEKAWFGLASFNGEAWFGYASFNGEALFGRAKFNGEANFGRATFKEKADFTSASFNGEAYFGFASFNGEARFYNASFKEIADFYDTTFSSEGVDLRKTRYPELQISWSQLKGRLDVALSQEDIVSWQGVYLKLIKNFKNIGNTKSADSAYYHYRYIKYMFCSSFWEKTKWWFGYLFMGLTCGYGVIPWRTIATAGILIFSFTLAYFFKIDSLEYKREEQTRASGNQVNHSFWHCLYFSVVTFTTLGYGDFRPLGKFRYVAMTEGIFGWLTMALFLVTLANVWL